MSGRRKIPSSFERRPIQSPGMMRHGPLPGSGPTTGHQSFESLPHPELLENKIAYQAAEIKQLAGDNNRLAASHVDLRRDLVAAEEDVERLKAHMRSIQTESDIQIRVLLDKIAKREADIKAGEGVKKELQRAHMEAQSLFIARQELTIKIQQAKEELQKARLDVQKLPDLNAELDSLREEHQRLRSTFEYEKGLNIEQVVQMKAMEKKLIGMAREVERLRDEVLNSEKREHGDGTVPYGSSSYVAAGVGVPTAAAGAIWGAAYDPSLDAAAPSSGVGAVWKGAYDSALSQ